MGWINDEIAESKLCYSSDFNSCGDTQVNVSVQRADYPGQGYKLYRVSVWGVDDFGMLFDTRSAVQASKLYEQLKNEPDLKISYLKEQGFTYF
jgi:hypothetical protein